MRVEQSIAAAPQPLIRAIEVVVEMARGLSRNETQTGAKPVQAIPRWEGGVIGTLSRSQS